MSSKTTLELRDYQRDMSKFVVDWLEKIGVQGAGLFVDMGLGKTAATLTALETLLQRGTIRSVLVIAPLRVIYNTWPDEIRKWTPRLRYRILHKHRGKLGRPTQIELQSCDSVHKLVDMADRWDCVVVDESSNFKTWTSRRMKSLRKMLKMIRKRVILTGTPTPESLAELHPQAFILDDGESLGKNITVFRSRYMERGGWMGRQWKLRSGVEDEINDKIGPRVMRVDAATHLDLPELIENDIWLSLPDKCHASYKTLKRKLYLALEEEERKGTSRKAILVGNAGGLYQKLKQLCNGQVYYETGEVKLVRKRDGGLREVPVRASEVMHDAKVAALREIVSENYGAPSIVLYQYVHDKDRIIEALGKKHTAVIDSSVSEVESKKIIGKWNARKIRYLVSHPLCLSHGLNLQHGGSDMVFFGVPDGCESYLQARARLHRSGQTNNVRIHRIVTRGTVEELQIERLRGKIHSQDDFLDRLKKHARV